MAKAKARTRPAAKRRPPAKRRTAAPSRTRKISQGSRQALSPHKGDIQGMVLLLLAALFALGVWAGEAGSLENLTVGAHRLGWSALAAAALWAALAVYLKTRGHLESAFHGAGWLVMLNVVLYSIIAVAFTVWFTAMIRAHWSGDGPLRARAGRASYATYVLHPLVLTAIMVLFASLALAPAVSFLVVAVVAVPVCFLAGYAATRVSGIARVL